MGVSLSILKSSPSFLAVTLRPLLEVHPRRCMQKRLSSVTQERLKNTHAILEPLSSYKKI